MHPQPSTAGIPEFWKKLWREGGNVNESNLLTHGVGEGGRVGTPNFSTEKNRLSGGGFI